MPQPTSGEKLGWKATGELTAAAQAARAIRGIFFLLHPFPALMNAVAGALFYGLAAKELHVHAVLLLFFSVFFVHASIGAMNDYCDTEVDRATKPDKPIVRAEISRETAFYLSALAAILGWAMAVFFGPWTLLIATAVLLSGMLYNLGAKGTPLSFVPYAIAIPSLPLWGFVAAGVFAPVLLMAYPLGILIALALNLANTIPDLDGDRRFGIRGLAHVLGLKRSLALEWACFAVSILLLSSVPLLLGNDARVLLPGMFAGTVLLAVMALDYATFRSQASLRRGWYMSAVLAVVLGLSWVGSLRLDQQ